MIISRSSYIVKNGFFLYCLHFGILGPIGWYVEVTVVKKHVEVACGVATIGFRALEGRAFSRHVSLQHVFSHLPLPAGPQQGWSLKHFFSFIFQN